MISKKDLLARIEALESKKKEKDAIFEGMLIWFATLDVAVKKLCAKVFSGGEA